jgi:hypothetical protein
MKQNFLFAILATLPILNLGSGQVQEVSILEPTEGSVVVGSAAVVKIGIAPEFVEADYIVCLELDRGRENCAPAEALVSQPITLNVLLPGERVLCAWLKSPAGQGQRSCRAFLVTRDAEDTNPLDVTRSTSRTQHCAADDTNCSTTLSRQEYFDFIYRTQLWKESPVTLEKAVRSGHGSTKKFTANIREVLMRVLEIPHDIGSVQRFHGVVDNLVPENPALARSLFHLKYNISSILDLPCGDMNWMPAQFIQSKGIKYTGADISEIIIRENLEQARFKGLEFLVLDAVEQVIPHGKYDLIFCRHMMYHLSPADNIKLLQTIDRSGAKYVMLTTYLRADENQADFVLAFGHKINLFRAPYCLRDPVELFLDGELDGYMGLWQLHPTVPLVQPGGCMGAAYHTKAEGQPMRYGSD